MARSRSLARAARESNRGDRLPITGAAIHFSLWVVVILVTAPIAAPSVFLFAWAFLGTETVGMLSDAVTLRWFREVLMSPEWRASLLYSTGLALAVSLSGCALLTAHFFYVRGAPKWTEPFSYGISVMPALVPAVVYALALRLIGGRLGLPEQALLGLGHLVFVLPVQYFVFETIQEGVSSDIIDASQTLGATPLRTLFIVYVPAILGAIRAAFVVGFFFSFDEIVVAAFVIESPLATVPKRLWDSVNRSMNPDPAVIATLLFFAYGVLSALSLVPWARVWQRVWRRPYREQVP